MSLVQAYKRAKQYTHTFPGFAPLVFTPNAAGDVVCDVVDAELVDRLLETPTGFRLYEVVSPAAASAPEPLSPVLTATKAKRAPKAKPAAVEVPQEPEAPSKYVLMAEDGTVALDLRPLGDEELLAFCDANGIATLAGDTGDTIRDTIVAFLTAEE